MKFKKIFKDLKYGVLKPKIFIILFGLFFSSIAIAATLTVTGLLTARIPPGDANCSNTNINGNGTHSLSNDRTEDPEDVQFSEDGLQVFTINQNQQEGLDLNMNTLSRPFDLTSIDTSDEISANNNGKGCDALDAFDPSDFGASTSGKYLDLNIVDGGKIFFLLSSNAELIKFNLSTPNDFRTATFEIENDLASLGSVAFSGDGTKLFTLQITKNAPNLTTFSLPAPFDISSLTQIHTVNLSSAYDFGGETENDTFAMDVEFNDTGSAMFVMNYNDASRDESYIYQFSLGTNYDVSTASLIGKYNIVVPTSGDGGMPRGFSFSSDGMKFFLVNRETGAAQVDRITEYELECPYGIVACTSDSTSSIGSQVELSKQNINLNVSTIFKRFEWIKRNRDKENLTSHNININYPNPLLKALAMQLQPVVKKNVVSLVSKSQKSEKKSKWSSWSLGDLSMNNYDKHGFEKAKSITTKGLTFGADRKFGDNKFLGLALRYGDNKSNISTSQQNTDMESLTLNIYGIIPINEDQYINTVIGLSALRFDNKYLGKLSGERNGKQAFTSINYRVQNSYGKFNITPTGKLTYGVTRLSDFTDFLSMAIDSPTTDIIYAEDTFESGEFSAGFLFEMDKIKNDQGTFQPMGGIEILYDLTPDIDYKYKYVGSTEVNKDTILGKYSRRSLKTEAGFEMISVNGFTVSPIYERITSLSNDNERKHYTERFVVKISRSKEEDNSEFALDFDPLSDNTTNLSYVKKLNGFDLKINSNYSLASKIPDYGAKIEVSSTF